MKIPTKGADGRSNGYVILGWNALDQPDERPDQVYHTAIAAHSMKGPHLHMVRCGRFQCVIGNVRIVTRAGAVYEVHYTGADHEYRVVKVPPGVVAALYNDGDTEALVVNMPTPAWSAENQDEHPVEVWVERSKGQ